MANISENFKFIIDSTTYTQLVHPDDGSTLSRLSEKVKGDGYYGRSDGFHSVQYNLSDFEGIISVQATLATTPAESDWFYAPITEHDAINTIANQTGSFIYNFTGNYVWVRISVSSWTAGNILSCLINH